MGFYIKHLCGSAYTRKETFSWDFQNVNSWGDSSLASHISPFSIYFFVWKMMPKIGYCILNHWIDDDLTNTLLHKLSGKSVMLCVDAMRMAPHVWSTFLVVFRTRDSENLMVRLNPGPCAEKVEHEGHSGTPLSNRRSDSNPVDDLLVSLVVESLGNDAVFVRATHSWGEWSL